MARVREQGLDISLYVLNAIPIHNGKFPHKRLYASVSATRPIVAGDALLSRQNSDNHHSKNECKMQADEPPSAGPAVFSESRAAGRAGDVPAGGTFSDCGPGRCWRHDLSLPLGAIFRFRVLYCTVQYIVTQQRPF
jgi:hypothetical protein